MSDPVNPSHYKHLPAEAIDIIEAAISKAPSNKAAYLHGQVLKYLLRCWPKKGIEDLRKAKWYLDRLVNSFDSVLAEINAPLHEKPDDQPSEDRPPAGWRKMEIGEDIEISDKFWFGGNWVNYEEEYLPCGKLDGLHVTHIRKIESPIDKPKRYRDPTPADLMNGPIDCEVRGSDSEDWVWRILCYIAYGSDRPFRVLRDRLQDSKGKWPQCRIEVTE
jgi:hypothetical protein